MPAKILYQPSPHKEEIKQLLRDGVSVEECATRFPLTERSIYRYYKELQNEKAGKAPPGKSSTIPAVTVPGVSKEAFTPVGAPTPPPPEQPAQEFVYVGPIRMPTIDFGYSTGRNMFIVIDTFEIARQEYNFPKTTKIGDFMAELCQAFRIMRGWDVIGAGVYPVKIEKEAGVK